jgi:tetratricopeptide (TPR) repeat protein
MTMRPNKLGESWAAAKARRFRRLTGSLTRLLQASLACLALTAFACTSGPGISETVRIAPDDLLAGTSLGVVADSAHLAEEQEVLSVSAEMKEFLDAHVDRKASADLKLRQLIGAIIVPGTFVVEYEATTRTASETFHIGRGNCLSFSTMFVAMARHVGLDVGYQEVDLPPDWTLNNDTFVLNQHVNVYVDLGLRGKRVVDFNIGDFKTRYEMRTISDARALAHYYNNIGVERMQAGDPASALACFRHAIADGDRRYAPAWTNLGTLYLRLGVRTHAEAAYLEALQATPGDLVAMSNLARFYELTGDRERAAAYQKRVIYHRSLNPYYRYELARQAYSAQHYDDAIGHLKYAIRMRRNEDRFYFLLGLAYLQKGDARAARHWIALAEEVAATDSLKHQYSEKIETLLRRGDR